MQVFRHYFVNGGKPGGVYLKEFGLDDGERVEQHRHTFDHVTLISEGCVLMEKDGTNSVHYAPAYLWVERGITHAFTALNGPARGYCTHLTDCGDPENIDRELINDEIGA